jgi:hypothetical protein
MSIWSIATDVAIWTLIAGSLAVFVWFLTEVVRLSRDAESVATGSEEDSQEG